MKSAEDNQDYSSIPSVSRRSFLQGLGVSASIVGMSSLINLPATSAYGAAAKVGGTLNVGLSGGSSSDTLDGNATVSSVDNARAWQLYNSLVEFDTKAVPRLSLASSITANSDATLWTIKLRDGVKFHDGKPLTADDVIFTFKRITNPKSPLQGAAGIASVDVAKIKKINNLTLEVPCTKPFAAFVEQLACYYYFILPTNWNAKHPTGTGPFKFESFTPGVQSVFTRNETYWESAKPYVDKLVIIDFADETSQINGLQSGQVQLVDQLSNNGLAEAKSAGAKTLVSHGGGFTPFTMRVDVAPFNDVRVREAFKLIVNRKQMLEQVFGGRGTIGNDIVAIWDPEYDHSIPQRTQNIKKAKALLKAAGHENLSVDLMTSDIAQGVVEAAQVFAQQASAAGVTVNVKTLTVSDFYGPNYLKYAFAQDYWFYAPYLPQVNLGFLPNSPFNETHFNNAQYESLYAKALTQVSAPAQKKTVHQMQKIEYDQGGYIIPYFSPVFDAYSSKVGGVSTSKTGIPLGNYGFKNMWLIE